MARTITVGLDGSPESRAAAEWAAREAALRQMPVRLLHVWQPVPEPMAQAPLLGAETHQHWTERIPREAAEGLRLRHPGVEVTTEQRAGAPAEVLLEAARDAELLVLGSRALSGLTGFLIGSVGQSVVARAEVPVILVRAGEQAADEHVKDPAGIPSAATGFRRVVLGLDTDSPDETVITFAFEEARRREATLTVVQGWNLPPYYVYSLAAGVDPREDIIREQVEALTEALLPWREKYPDVEVTEASRLGSPAGHLVDAAHEASPVVVGRRIRRSPFGVHIGAVAHAVMHHATAPVAVVAHD
ncbi:universal stress protein [Streptomyces calvus]|uniref:Nucleotide-binding universal stress UspA family protein n=1 Tax=Streptomyces calvus TaxID=67282 RepID=A0AA40VFL0_9ACTN|nr:universal stress protein [Streptomyces calvus]MBA8944327.1 nucleotide-binding universal stress UspA family protein [Streptomyces calvus]GGP54814.1 stress-inducible protein [Streptomyces calvus]